MLELTLCTGKREGKRQGFGYSQIFSHCGNSANGIDLNDDLIDGPSILNIGIDGLPFQKIFIRAEYIRIYDLLDHRELSRFPNGLAPAAVLTGQPGNAVTVSSP